MRNPTRTIALLLIAFPGALPAGAQIPGAGEDETWKENFPLQIGNVWQFEYEVSDQMMFTDLLAIEWRVTEERLLGDTLYFEIQVRCDTLQVALPNRGCEPGVTDTVLVRYDEERRTVMRRGGPGSDACPDPFFSDEFPLDVAADSVVTSQCGDSQFWQETDPVTIGNETYQLTGFRVTVESIIPQGYHFARGVGPISFGGCEGGCWDQTLTYARIGDTSYGSYRRIPAGWQVTGTDPAAGETAVLVDTVDFTFSAAVDASIPLSFVIHPASAILDEVTLSDDGRTARIPTSHEENRDYTWVLSGAQSETGAPLARPEVLRYTTAAATGGYSASGEAHVILLLGTEAGPPVPEEILVALLTRRAEPNIGAYAALNSEDVAGATRLDENGLSWSIDGLRPGTYWPVALWDGDQDGDPDVVGGYDEWQSIEIVDTNVSGIELLMVSGTSTEQPSSTAAIELEAPYPNPTTGSFAIPVTVTAPGHMTVEVYDVLGRRVAALRSGAILQHERHEVSGDLSRLPAGVYFIRAITEGGQTTQPIIVR